MDEQIVLDQSSVEMAQSIREQALKIHEQHHLSEIVLSDLNLIHRTLPMALDDLGLDQPHYKKMLAAQYREENDLTPEQMTDEEIWSDKLPIEGWDLEFHQVRLWNLKPRT